MRSIVIFRFFSHLSLLFVYQCITFLPLIFRFSFYTSLQKNDKVHTDIVLANRETGLEKGIRQVALNMKQKGIEGIAIMECTGLDAGTVAEL